MNYGKIVSIKQVPVPKHEHYYQTATLALMLTIEHRHPYLILSKRQHQNTNCNETPQNCRLLPDQGQILVCLCWPQVMVIQRGFTKGYKCPRTINSAWPSDTIWRYSRAGASTQHMSKNTENHTPCDFHTNRKKIRSFNSLWPGDTRWLNRHIMTLNTTTAHTQKPVP